MFEILANCFEAELQRFSCLQLASLEGQLCLASLHLLLDLMGEVCDV